MTCKPLFETLPVLRSLNLGNVGINFGSQGKGASLKYEDWRHSSAVALLVGSYLHEGK